MFNTQEQKTTQNKTKRILVIIAICIWVFIGLTAFFMTMYCYSKGSTFWQTIIGLFLSIFCGPLYWIYYFVSKTYCKDNYIQPYINASRVGGKKY
jgi:flagellar basal body-associated protein FliL